jgi:DNA-binding FrmR family transcriptional regulator
MKTGKQSELVVRFKKIEGQVRALSRMIEEDRPCEEIVTQLAAARAAMDQAGFQFVASRLRECLNQHDETISSESTMDLFLDHVRCLTRQPEKEIGSAADELKILWQMLDEHKPCDEILAQYAAARLALDQAGYEFVSTRLQECMSRGELGEQQKGKAQEKLLKIFFDLARILPCKTN